jgi:ubiquinone/menaquinone biosynthesis C-methylase UbiE
MRGAIGRLCGVLVLTALTTVTTTGQTRAVEPEREQWQRVAELFGAMAIHQGDSVADVGAGEGFATVRLSPIVGSAGKVFAEDVADAPLGRLRTRVEEAGLANVTIIKGDADDPHLPSSALDAVIILNAYHEMAAYQDVLRHIREALKPGGRLVIAEPSPVTPGLPRADQIKVHRISGAFVADEVAQAGFTIIERQDEFTKKPVPYSMVVARRP